MGKTEIEEAKEITITTKEKLEACSRMAEQVEFSLRILRNALKMAIDMANADDETINRQVDAAMDKLLTASVEIADAAYIAYSVVRRLKAGA